MSAETLSLFDPLNLAVLCFELLWWFNDDPIHLQFLTGQVIDTQGTVARLDSHLRNIAIVMLTILQYIEAIA